MSASRRRAQDRRRAGTKAPYRQTVGNRGKWVEMRVDANAFRKFNGRLSRRDVPIIARRFNAGIVVGRIRVPKGRLNVNRSLQSFSRPFGTLPGVAYIPAFKRWAIFICPSGTSISEFPKGMRVNAASSLGEVGMRVWRFRPRPPLR